MCFPKGFVFKAGILFASFIFVLGFTNQVRSQCNVAISSFPHEQGFNSASRPACWTEEAVNGTAALSYTSVSTDPLTSPYEGSNFVVFPSRTLTEGTELRLVSPLLSRAADSYLNVDFYWYAENHATYRSLTEGVQIQYSLDGINWINVGDFIPRHDETLNVGSAQWKNKIVPLAVTTIAQPIFYIGFKFRSENGNNLGLDHVKFTTTACHQTLDTDILLRDCDDPVHAFGTRTEIEIDEQVVDMVYSTTRIAGGTNVGTNTGGGNGGGLSVGFIPESDFYRVSATKTGCPDLTTDVGVYVPSVDIISPYLTGDTFICSGNNAFIQLNNAQNNVTYELLLNGVAVDDFFGYPLMAVASSTGTYSVKGCIEGGGNSVAFGSLVIRDYLPLPTSTGFNSNQIEDECWTQQTLSSNNGYFYLFNAIPDVGPQEGQYNVAMSGDANSEARLISPRLSSLLNSVVNLEFYFYNENRAAYSNTSEGVQLQYSLNGTDWTNAGSFYSRHDASLPINTGAWQKKTVLFPSNAAGQATLYIAFKGTRIYSDRFIAIDNVKFTSTLFPLPITVEYFKGKMNNGNVDLEWKVNCEDAIGSSVKFEIERSADGRRFETIHSLTESTNRCLQPFNYRDAYPLPSKNYYRIKMTEMDGKVSFTPIVAVLNKENGFELVSVSPTLVQNATTLHLAVAKNTKLEFNIHDAQGRLVHKSVKALNAGSQTISFNFGHLAAGTYQLTAYDDNGEKQNIVFIKQ